MKPEALEFLMELYKEGVARREAMEIVLEDLADNPPNWTKIAADQLRGLDDGSKDYARGGAPARSAAVFDKPAAMRSAAVLAKLPGNGFAKAAVDFYHPGLGAGVGAGLGALGGYMSYLGGRRRDDAPDWKGWARNVLGGAALGGVGGGLLSKGLGALHGPPGTGDAETDAINYLRAANPDKELPFVPRKDKLMSTFGANVAEGMETLGRAGAAAWAGKAGGGNPWLTSFLQAGRPIFNGLDDLPLVGTLGRGAIDFATGASALAPYKPPVLPRGSQPPALPQTRLGRARGALGRNKRSLMGLIAAGLGFFADKKLRPEIRNSGAYAENGLRNWLE